MSYDMEPETRRKRAHGSAEVKGRNVAHKKASDATGHDLPSLTASMANPARYTYLRRRERPDDLAHLQHELLCERGLVVGAIGGLPKKERGCQCLV
jgi:hypothetical protein